MSTAVDENDLPWEHVQALRNFTLVSENQYPLSHVRQPSPDVDDIHDCDCTFPQEQDGESRRRCYDESCLNYATYVECTAAPETEGHGIPSMYGGGCKAGKYCENQRLQQKKFPKFQAFKTEYKGFGVKTCEFIKENTLFAEYCGEMIDQAELDRRLESSSRKETAFYYLMLEPDLFVDARNRGSMMRFVNHSCDPNCVTQKWSVGGETRIGVVALRDIQAGEELCFDYQWKSFRKVKVKCFCGSKKCTGYIGAVDESNDEAGELGIYRDPTEEESQDGLVGSTIRLRNTLRQGFVKKYVHSSNQYVIDYNDEDDNTRESTISLPEKGWQVFVSFEGHTEEEIQKMIFAIPKKKRENSMTSNSVRTTREEGDSSQRQQSSSVFKGFGFNKQREEKIIPSRKRLLIKTKNVTESKIKRELSLRAKLMDFEGASDQRGTTWVMATFASEAVMMSICRTFKSSVVLGPHTKYYPAMLDEESQFRRFSSFCAKRKEAAAKVTSNNTSNDSSEELRFHYGVRLCWNMSPVDLESAPWRLAGVSSNLDAGIRRNACEMIQRASKSLSLGLDDVYRSMQLFHRYLAINAFEVGDATYLAIACLFVVMKSYSRSFVLPTFLQKTYAAQSDKPKAKSELEVNSGMYKQWLRRIIDYESKLLKGVHLDLCIGSVFPVLEQICFKHLHIRDIGSQVLVQSFANVMWITLSPEIIVVAAVYFSTALYQVSQIVRNNDDIESCHFPDWLPSIESRFSRNFSDLKTALDALLSLYDNFQLKDFRTNAVVPNPPKLLVSSVCHAWRKAAPPQHRNDDDKATYLDYNSIIRPMVSSSATVTTPSVKQIKNQQSSSQLTTSDFLECKQLGKRSFALSSVVREKALMFSESTKFFAQPLPFRGSATTSGVVGTHTGLLRELTIGQQLYASAPWGFLKIHGVLSPSGDTQETTAVLDPTTHYVLQELPTHNLAGLVRYSTSVPEDFTIQILKDIVRSISIVHEQQIVHRNVAMHNVFVFKDRAKLGGFHFARHFTPGKTASYVMSSNDIHEHCAGGLLALAAPELLLGSRRYTPAADMWALGILISTVLFRQVLFCGSDAKKQVGFIFRVLGSPTEKTWKKCFSLPKYKSLKPEGSYRSRFAKTLQEKHGPIRPDVMQVLESLLTLNPEDRISARDLLSLPLFAREGVYRSHDEEESSKFYDKCSIPKETRYKALSLALDKSSTADTTTTTLARTSKPLKNPLKRNLEDNRGILGDPRKRIQQQ